METKANILTLFDHNQKAYEAARYLMLQKGKAAIIHPTGTGKSFIAFKLALDLPDQRILWLAPSEYIFRTQIENLKKTLNVSEQEKEDILETLLKNITFITYTKLMVNEDMIDSFLPDYIILDEFHRCGAPEWGNSVRKLMEAYPESKLLGLSATNIRYLDNQRDMAKELFDGHIASEMTLGEAIARAILPAPSYVISMYSYKEELERLSEKTKYERNPVLKKQNEKLIESLKRTLENAEGLDQIFAKHMGKDGGKYLVFCANKDHMNEMLLKVNDWFRLVDRHPHVYAVHYDNPETSKEFADFKADESCHLRLLFCIDMLNEGVHVENLDGIILLRPTVSPILYLQQIGRGLSTGRGREHTPIIFDIVNNFDNLSSVDTLKNEFEEALFCIPYSVKERRKVNADFKIIDELRDCRKLFKQLSNNLSASWDIYYIEAEKYYQDKGNLKIPSAYVTSEGLKLGSWIQAQRRVYLGKTAGKLSDEQISRLEDIGMIWEDGPSQSFHQGCAELEQYYRQYGNTDVPARYVSENGFPLGKWISNVRAAYKNELLAADKIERLNELGMVWDVREYRWNLNYEAAKEYYYKHGSLQMPFDYTTENGICLGRWLSDQIRIYSGQKVKGMPLTPEQISKLEGIGIVWKNRYENNWDKKYEIAKAYYEEHGNLNISSTYVKDGVDIGKWISMIRLKMNNPKSSNLILSKKRIMQMNDIGMEWEKEAVSPMS